MKRCSYCGTTTAYRFHKSPMDHNKTVCGNCYQMFRRSDGVYPVPPEGEIHYSPAGWPICHVCGIAIRKVVQHAYYKHNLTEKEYKKKFKLNRVGILSADSKALARQRVFENPHCISENLIQHGIKTRYVKDDPRTKENTMTLFELNRRKANGRRD